MSNWMDIEATLSEEAWEVIEATPMADDLLDCLGMGLNVILEVGGIGLIAAVASKAASDLILKSNPEYLMIDVDSGEVIRN